MYLLQNSDCVSTFEEVPMRVAANPVFAFVPENRIYFSKLKARVPFFKVPSQRNKPLLTIEDSVG